MATKKIFTVATNTAPALVLTATRGKVVVPLNATTVTLIITKSGAVTNTGHQTCTITDAPNGIVSYTRQTGDIPTAGSYTCDLKITYADTTFEILYDQLQIIARKPAGT